MFFFFFLFALFVRLASFVVLALSAFFLLFCCWFLFNFLPTLTLSGRLFVTLLLSNWLSLPLSLSLSLSIAHSVCCFCCLFAVKDKLMNDLVFFCNSFFFTFLLLVVACEMEEGRGVPGAQVLGA